MELSKGCLGLLLHSVEIPLQAISWVDLKKELEELLESVVGVWQVTYKARSVSSMYGANAIMNPHKVIFPLMRALMDLLLMQLLIYGQTNLWLAI